MVQPEKLFLNQFNHLMLHLLERIVVSDGQMHIIIVIDHNIKVMPDIHLIGKEFFQINNSLIYLFIFSVDIQKNMEKEQ